MVLTTNPLSPFFFKRKVYLGPILYFPGEGAFKPSVYSFFYIEQGFDRLDSTHHFYRKICLHIIPLKLELSEGDSTISFFWDWYLFLDMKLKMKRLALERDFARAGAKSGLVILYRRNWFGDAYAPEFARFWTETPFSLHPTLPLLLGINLYLTNPLLEKVKVNQLSPPS